MRKLLILMGALAAPAWADEAQSLNAFTPPPGDVSVHFLREIFGSLVDTVGPTGAAAGDTTQTVVGAMMGVFGWGVLLLGMLFVFYATIKGTVDTANDGVLLGKKMSSVWVPIRTVGGMAVLMPSVGGYCLLQVIVLWLAVQGAGLADGVWAAAMNTLSVNGTLGRVSLPDARPLAANILKFQVCQGAMNKTFAEAGDPRRITLLPALMQTLPKGGQVTVMRWGSMNYANPAVCGSLSWQTSIAGTEADNYAFAADQAFTYVGGMGDESAVQASASPLLNAQHQALMAMIDRLRPLAESIVAGQRGDFGAVDAAADAYEDAIAKAAKAVVDASPQVAEQAFIKHAKDGGWILAGTWFNQMLRVNDSIQAAAMTTPTVTPITIDSVETPTTLLGYQDFMTWTDEYLKNRGNSPKKAYEEDVTSAMQFRSADDVWKVLSRPAMKALDALTERIAGSGASPLLQLRAVGNDIVTAGTAIKGAMFVVSGFAGSNAATLTVGNLFNLSEALKSISGTVEWVSSSLWGLGVVLAYYLPAVPAIWFVMGCIRWLASVVEAVLAAPIMASMVIHPGGDDVAGRAGPGMMLIVGMVLQPTLLVIGFVCAALMTYPAGELVNMVFMGMVSGITGSSSVGVVGLVAWTALYVVMMVTAIHACFALISAIPDSVMRYVGSQAGAGGVVDGHVQKTTTTLEHGAGGAGHGMAKGAHAAPHSGGGGGAVKGGGEANGLRNAGDNSDHFPQR